MWFNLSGHCIDGSKNGLAPSQPTERSALNFCRLPPLEVTSGNDWSNLCYMLSYLCVGGFSFVTVSYVALNQTTVEKSGGSNVELGLRLVANKNADALVNGIIATPERKQMVDFSYFVWTEPYTMVVPRPGEEPSLCINSTISTDSLATHFYNEDRHGVRTEFLFQDLQVDQRQCSKSSGLIPRATDDVVELRKHLFDVRLEHHDKSRRSSSPSSMLISNSSRGVAAAHHRFGQQLFGDRHFLPDCAQDEASHRNI
ncbi:hypothetical protein DAPPUDRAFT_103893 [Daphnia pulex]|uniref:Uncharacterized protein n=1 Tax=Daphnia pulex TaxID=6669 RepID=E9GKP8_DAPPU|nr:hypothetical protein DAPPUDRAFT_103893 [Daphnia pulex]|eukprot:EFX79934.1 hypothetical protein DAPPUDRAFT_103893 [Daphnia pulex]